MNVTDLFIKLLVSVYAW